MSQINAQNKAMYEEKGKFMNEIRKMKEELAQAVEERNNFEHQLSMSQDAVRSIQKFKEQLN